MLNVTRAQFEVMVRDFSKHFGNMYFPSRDKVNYSPYPNSFSFGSKSETEIYRVDLYSKNRRFISNTCASLIDVTSIKIIYKTGSSHALTSKNQIGVSCIEIDVEYQHNETFDQFYDRVNNLIKLEAAIKSPGIKKKQANLQGYTSPYRNPPLKFILDVLIELFN